MPKFVIHLQKTNKMIINFSVENFGSIKEKQTLSFLANKSDHLEDYYIIEPIKGLRLNKLALIYGANASGKTTILKAFSFLVNIVINPFDKKNTKFDFEPFLFVENPKKTNTKFEIEFIQKGVQYFYEVELNKDFIVKEKLLSFNPNKSIVYERTTDENKELAKIKFGNKILKKKLLESNFEILTLWNNTVLGGYFKANVESKELQDISEWFEGIIPGFIASSSDLKDVVSTTILEDNLNKKFNLKILNKADLNITDIDFNPNIKKNDEVINFSEEDIFFTHNIKGVDYKLIFSQESEGTKKYYGLSSVLEILLKTNSIITIDELESSLHPDLYLHFLMTYIVNSKTKSQFIATTHNREILNNRDIFRDDAIWFTDKNENSATELYSLADFDSSVVRDTTNVLNAYKSGKLGGVPNLGDYYINLDEE